MIQSTNIEVAVNPKYKIFAVVTILAAFILLLLHGPQHYTDSEGYLDGVFIRAPLYPFVIDVFRFFFGEYFEYWLVAFQLILGGWAVHSFCSVVSRQLSLPPWGFAVTLLLAATPYFGISGQTGNAILSEGLAYPLFLFAMRFLINGIVEVSFRSIGIFVLFSVLLVLTRKQFLFLFPIALFAILYFLFRGGGRAKMVYLLVILVVGGFLAGFIEYTNNYVRHGYFGPFPYTGNQFITMAIYVSKSGDVLATRDEQQAKLFQEIYYEASLRKLTLESLGNLHFQGQFINRFQHFFINYGNILTTASRAVEKVYFGKSSTTSAKFAIAERETTRLALTLIRENPLGYAMMYLLNISYGLGGRDVADGYGMRGNYLALLQFVALLLLCIYAIPYPRKRPAAVMMLFMLLLHLANVAEVALVSLCLDRYTFYTSTVLMVFLAALISKGVESLD